MHAEDADHLVPPSSIDGSPGATGTGPGGIEPDGDVRRPHQRHADQGNRGTHLQHRNRGLARRLARGETLVHQPYPPLILRSLAMHARYSIPVALVLGIASSASAF